MNDQYYTADPTSQSKPVPCAFPYRGYGLNFMTDAGVFSKGELDVGSRLLLDALPDFAGDVLDIGCGWGAIGVAVAKANKQARVTMVDVNRRALGLCEENCRCNGVTAEVLESDGMAAVMGRKFDAIVTNPPIRAGKQVIYKMFADAAASLNDGGALYLVIRKQQGAESCVKYLKTLFDGVEKLDKSAGFWVLKAYEPKSQEDTNDEV
ncbi:MAG: class I SAM-dependent methyltransferase [Clostridia bacterium]|nr:class I SAM-dependent methyltransferase [Clostridia bacterium]